MNAQDLEKYSRLRNLNLGQAEKDYYQNIILFALYGKFTDELVFKGGTALFKCYGLNRFSEDLDFTLAQEKDVIGVVTKGLDDFGIKHLAKNVIDSSTSKKYKIKIEGPLYKGMERTLCSVTVDVSLREKVLFEPNIIATGHHMDVIPVFDVYVMKEEEVFAEKVRAIIMRESARDLYDLAFLSKKGVKVEMSTIAKKLELNSLKFDKGEFLKKCKALDSNWDNELRSFVKHVPAFKECMNEAEKWAQGIQ